MQTYRFPTIAQTAGDTESSLLAQDVQWVSRNSLQRGSDRQVTVVETGEMLGDGMVDAMLAYLMIWFKKKGVTLISGVKEYVEITDKGLTIINSDGEKQTIEADSIVTALPLTPNNGLLEGLKSKVPEVYAIGDCREPDLIVDAIADGSRVGKII